MATSQTTPDKESVRHIAVCGGGLAASMAIAALARHLPADTRLTHVKTGVPDAELFYGDVTAPSAYAFNLSVGVTEPALVLESNTAFSLGTRYDAWGEAGSWVQCFHQPLPVLAGVQFHHYLARQGIRELEPFLVSAMAARKGAFAHPPEDRNHALAGAEYGYQFDAVSYAKLFSAATDKGRVQTIESAVADVEHDEGSISALRLANGETVSADLYVDCTGPEATLLCALSATFEGDRRLGAARVVSDATGVGAPYRTVTATDYGWLAQTPLKDKRSRMVVFDPDTEEVALSDLGASPESQASVTLGRRAAWAGNCVGLGLSAGVIEPLSPAPMVLLQRDVERLLSLIPLSSDMAVERREYNRQFAEDFDHASLFNRALFETGGLPDTPYWKAACSEPVPDKLQRKLTQFTSRGLHVAYDLEPFNEEDWIIQHYGMGRVPARHDRLADQAPAEKVQKYLDDMRNGIGKLVASMPGHEKYMTGLARYLMQNKG